MITIELIQDMHSMKQLILLYFFTYVAAQGTCIHDIYTNLHQIYVHKDAHWIFLLQGTKLRE